MEKTENKWQGNLKENMGLVNLGSLPRNTR